jgi:hypothetical protein
MRRMRRLGGRGFLVLAAVTALVAIVSSGVFDAKQVQAAK